MDHAAPSGRPSYERWVIPISVVLLAWVTMGQIVGNPFIRDDTGLIVSNTLTHAWSGLWRAFGAAYWPPADSGELYRPLTTALFTVQWMLGGGKALLFRLVSLLVYALSGLAVWTLLRRLVSPAAAWAGAALFVVHPVHVEAMVEAASQSESIVAALIALAVAWHIDANRGTRDLRRTMNAESLCFAAALFFKEHALVLPALLVAADLLLDPAPGAFRARWKQWRWHYAALFVIAAAFWALRTAVLGLGAGTGPQEALEGGMLARAFTMTGVPAEWLRLFIWPAHLQHEWSLFEWAPSTAWSLRETTGVIAMASVLLAFALAWRRRPVVAFGIGWTVIALGPVANILLPTGVLIAERTLFLPSVGFIVVCAGLIDPVTIASATLSPWRRRIGVGIVGIVLGLGMLRSALRVVDWHTTAIWVATAVREAPLSWRTHLSYAMMLVVAGDTTDARSEVRRTIALRPDKPVVPKVIADNARLQLGECEGAVIVYDEILRVAPGRSDIRASLLACLAYLGHYEEAKRVAEAGVALGGADSWFYVRSVKRAEQSIAQHTPAGAWRLRFPTGTMTDVGGPVRHP